MVTSLLMADCSSVISHCSLFLLLYNRATLVRLEFGQSSGAGCHKSTYIQGTLDSTVRLQVLVKHMGL